MNGKIARALRKECNYTPSDTRNYQEIEFVVKKQIYQLDGDKVKLVWRDVPAFLIECTSGARKVYQYMKKKWNNPEYEVSLNKLPSLADLENIENIVTKDEDLTKEMIDSKKKTTGKL